MQAQRDGTTHAATWGPWSDSYLATTDTPQPVTGLAVSDPTSSITVSWDEQPGVLFEVRYRKAGVLPHDWTSVRDVTGTSYVVTGLDANSRYNFRMRAWGVGERYARHKSKISPDEPVSITTLP